MAQTRPSKAPKLITGKAGLRLANRPSTSTTGTMAMGVMLNCLSRASITRLTCSRLTLPEYCMPTTVNRAAVMT